METGSFVTQRSPEVLRVGTGVHRAAQTAAALTIGSVVTLGIFYTVGEPWGTLNDGITIALAAATVPIAVGLARHSRRSALLDLGVVADVAGAATTIGFTTLLIAGTMTFEASLPFVLTGQGLIGCWLVLVGVVSWSVPGTRRLAAFGVAGGAGLALSVLGFAIGGIEHPLTIVGGAVGLLGTVGFYALLSRRTGRRDGGVVAASALIHQ
jgi:hypothetical protein